MPKLVYETVDYEPKITKKPHKINILRGLINGGRGGIRTLGALLDTPPFQGGTFNHSATLPRSTSPLSLSSGTVVYSPKQPAWAGEECALYTELSRLCCFKRTVSASSRLVFCSKRKKNQPATSEYSSHRAQSQKAMPEILLIQMQFF